MSILIKGMEMPENCMECDIRAVDDDGQYCPFTKVTALNIGRQDNCPLIEVTEPHGRLIDADFEEKHYASMTINPTPDVTPQDYMHSGYAAKAFQMAKAVIEAEE